MEDLKIRWFPDAASRFIELLQQHSWNQAVTLLRAEKEEGKADHEDI